MADEPSLSEIVRITDRHERKISDIEERYVSEKVYLAMLNPLEKRVLALEQNDTSKATGNRTWILGLAQTVMGVILSAVATVLIVRGGR